jgi:hypothetical protein
MSESLNLLAEDIGLNPNHTSHETSDNIPLGFGFGSVNYFMVNSIRQIEKPEERRPLLSLFTCITKHSTEVLTGLKLSNYEWKLARQHAKYPGPGRPVKKLKFFYRRLNDEVVDQFMEWLHAQDLLQSVAYGHKVIKWGNGSYYTIESVKRKECMREINMQYIDTWREESEKLDVHNRCHKLCSKSRLRCFKTSGHNGNCAFTLDGN